MTKTAVTLTLDLAPLRDQLSALLDACAEPAPDEPDDGMIRVGDRVIRAGDTVRALHANFPVGEVLATHGDAVWVLWDHTPRPLSDNVDNLTKVTP